MKRIVLDRDLNALIEENIKKAWEERNKGTKNELEGETDDDKEDT
jgi:hypothetical protein